MVGKTEPNEGIGWDRVLPGLVIHFKGPHLTSVHSLIQDQGLT